MGPRHVRGARPPSWGEAACTGPCPPACRSHSRCHRPVGLLQLKAVTPGRLVPSRPLRVGAPLPWSPGCGPTDGRRCLPRAGPAIWARAGPGEQGGRLWAAPLLRQHSCPPPDARSLGPFRNIPGTPQSLYHFHWGEPPSQLTHSPFVLSYLGARGPGEARPPSLPQLIPTRSWCSASTGPCLPLGCDGALPEPAEAC